MALLGKLSLQGTYKYAHFVFINNFIRITLKCHNFYIQFWIETIHVSLESSRRDHFGWFSFGTVLLGKPFLRGTYKYTHFMLIEQIHTKSFEMPKLLYPISDSNHSYIVGIVSTIPFQWYPFGMVLSAKSSLDGTYKSASCLCPINNVHTKTFKMP